MSSNGVSVSDHQNILLNMQDILVYIVYSRHHSFLNLMVKNTIDNIKQAYQSYDRLVQKLERLEMVLSKEEFSYEHKVILFFFFLSIDQKMRHWILSSQQEEKYKKMQIDLLKTNVSMVPKNSLVCVTNTQNPFLGQNVVFKPLKPHAAVSIFVTICDQSFFEPLFLSDDSECFHEIFSNIKYLVLLS